MTYRGHIQNGQITLDGQITLPDGTKVNIEVLEEGAQEPRPSIGPYTREFEPIEMPGGSLADELVRDRR